MALIEIPRRILHLELNAATKAPAPHILQWSHGYRGARLYVIDCTMPERKRTVAMKFPGPRS